LLNRNRLPVRLLLLEYPVRGLRQVAGYRHHRFGVSFTGLDSLVELNRMAVRPPVLVEYHHIGSFDEGSLEVMV